MLNVAVIFGGVSCEHDISIITGVQVVNNLDDSKYSVIPIYIDKNAKWYYLPQKVSIEDVLEYEIVGKRCSMSADSKCLYTYQFGKLKKRCQIDLAILAMHGLNGEDGSVAALMQLNGISCINCPMLCSSLCLDKITFKNYLAGLSLINYLPYISYNSSDDYVNLDKKIVKSFGYPVILKPANLGSSIGIAVCNNFDDLQQNLLEVIQYDKNILVEKKLKNFVEYNIAVVKFRNEFIISSIEEPISKNQILTYSDKYLAGNKIIGMESLTRKFPAKLSSSVKKKIESWSVLLYKNLKMRGVVRFDYLFDNDEQKLYINEANTIPGSYANYLFEGMSFSDLLNGCIDNAIFESQSDNTIKYFESSVLSNVGNLGKINK